MKNKRADSTIRVIVKPGMRFGTLGPYYSIQALYGFWFLKFWFEVDMTWSHSLIEDKIRDFRSKKLRKTKDGHLIGQILHEE